MQKQKQKRNKKVTTVVVTKNAGQQTGSKKKKQKKTTKAGRTLRLSECSTQYALAISNPWRANSPCIPDLISIPSIKLRTVNRGTFNLGTSSTGWVLVKPQSLIYNNGASWTNTGLGAGSYPPAILCTSATFPDTGFGFQAGLGTITTGITQSSGNSPFNTDYLIANAAIKYRLVGCGIKVTYTGTELDLGGRCATLNFKGADGLMFSPGDATLSLDTLLRDPLNPVVSEKSSRKMHFVNFFPTSQQEFGYRSLTDVVTTAARTTSTKNLVDGYQLAIAIAGAKPGVSYMYEIIAHFEIIGPVGPNVYGNAQNFTKSESDPIGLASVANVSGQQLQTTMDDPDSYSANFHRMALKSLMGLSGFIGPIIYDRYYRGNVALPGMG
jgi:hypothetical protein